MLVARTMTLDAIQRIASGIQPGMVEEDAVQLAKRVLKDAGLLRGWHGVRVRFGPNTLNVYSDVSEPHTVLQGNDIFFIDIGPVWQKWEGDGGNTFVVGNDVDMHRAAQDVRKLFDRVHAKWRSDALTGVALYEYATEQARAMGWLLNLESPGHRLADFPHAAVYDGALSSAPFSPATDLWVLEVQIRHPERPFGAFFEDLLLA
jgi:Xaa-Pro aminopeptidase